MESIVQSLQFGEYLYYTGRVNILTIAKALQTQKKENYSRKIGEVLLNDFDIFSNKEDLDKELKKFEDKATQIKTSSNNPLLEFKLGDILENLESYNTTNVVTIVGVLDELKRKVCQIN